MSALVGGGIGGGLGVGGAVSHNQAVDHAKSTLDKQREMGPDQIKRQSRANRKYYGAKYAGIDKLASLANSELLDRALRGEIDPDVLTKLADSVGPEGAGGVDASTGITINDASSGTVAPDDKAVAFRQALEQSARHQGENMHQSSDVVGMPGGSAGDATTPAIPSY